MERVGSCGPGGLGRDEREAENASISSSSNSMFDSASHRLQMQSVFDEVAIDGGG